jgi:nucleoside-diphosphate-sugar epimerase
MKVLFIGGTGIISTAVSRLAVERGIELTLLTRGSRSLTIPGAQTIECSITDEDAVLRNLRGKHFDSVVDWIAFGPDDIERDLRLLREHTDQFVFISSASAYQKPVRNYLITESTPLENPYWEYSRLKIAAEERLMRAFREDRFPATIVRPSFTYGDTIVPLAANSWYPYSYTIVDRMRRGKPVVVPGDGTSLWVMTHNSDFAKGFLGLLGRREALGEAYHITSDEVLNWNQIYEQAAAAAGVEPNLIHIPSDFVAACIPEKLGSWIGDKANSVVFDNSKIKALVPDFKATTPFAEGIKQTIAWFDADASRRQIEPGADEEWDRIIDAYQSGLRSARSAFGPK